jgi:hypothetical protein
MKSVIVMLAALLAFSSMSLATANVIGNWKATIETPDGSHEQTFEFKMDGGKLTGTVGSEMGSLPIGDGKLDGDRISFSARSEQFALRYSGTVSGDTMKLTVTVGDGQFTFNANATRVKA